MTPFETYVAYVAIKKHFAGNFDYFKYAGKVRLSHSSFEARRDRYKFEKLARHHDPIGLLVANVARDPDVWIGDVVDGDQSGDRYGEYVKNTQSFSYIAERQLTAIAQSTFKDTVFNHEMIRAVASGDVSLELAAMLDTATHMTDDWNSSPSHIKMAKRIRGYAPFVKEVVPLKRFSSLVKKLFDEDGNRRKE